MGLSRSATGPDTVRADALDPEAVRRAVGEVEPEVIVHQLTALSRPLDLRHFDRDFALTNRLRTEGTDKLLAAGREVGVRLFVAQSYAGWPYARTGTSPKTEEDPLDPSPGTSLDPHGGTHAAAIRARKFPIVGGGTGQWSFIHVADAAEATVAAIERGRRTLLQHRRRRAAAGLWNGSRRSRKRSARLRLAAYPAGSGDSRRAMRGCS